LHTGHARLLSSIEGRSSRLGAVDCKWPLPGHGGLRFSDPAAASDDRIRKAQDRPGTYLTIRKLFRLTADLLAAASVARPLSR
jgi:hypothetical protein